MPVPHSATLIMSRSSPRDWRPARRWFSLMHTEYAALGGTLPCVDADHGDAADGRGRVTAVHGGSARTAGGDAPERRALRARSAGAQMPVAGGGWSTVSCARMESSLPIVAPFGRLSPAGAGGCPQGMRGGRGASTVSAAAQPSPKSSSLASATAWIAVPLASTRPCAARRRSRLAGTSRARRRPAWRRGWAARRAASLGRHCAMLADEAHGGEHRRPAARGPPRWDD